MVEIWKKNHAAHYHDLLALVVCAAGEGDSDAAAGELPVEDDDHDLVGGCAALLQRLVRLVNQVLQFLVKNKKGWKDCVSLCLYDFTKKKLPWAQSFTGITDQEYESFPRL